MANILFYSNTTKERKECVEALFTQHHFPYILVDPTYGEATIKDLLAQIAIPQNDASLFEMDLLLFDGMHDEQIQEVSALLRAQGIDIPYKAVVTATNQEWKLKDLLQEILEEHAFFQSYEKLHQLLIELGDVQKDDYTEASWNPYQMLCVQAYSLLQEEKQPSLKLLDSMIEMIEKAKHALVRKTIE